MKAADRLLGMGPLGEVHEGKSPWPPALPLDGQRHQRHRADSREQVCELCRGGLIRQIAYEQPAGWTPSAGGGLRTRTGFGDREGMAVELDSVQLLNSLLGLPIAHFNKAESPGMAGLTVPHNPDGHYASHPREQAAEFLLGSGGRKIADIDLLHHSPLANASRW